MYSLIPITLDNIEEVKPWATEFMGTMQYECNAEYYCDKWKGFLKAGIGVGWWMSCDGQIVGGIGGIVAPDMFSGKDTMIELFWYLTPAHRRQGLRLFNKMEQYVNDHKYKWVMIHMEHSMPEKLKSFYTKKQFHLMETYWVKEAIV